MIPLAVAPHAFPHQRPERAGADVTLADKKSGADVAMPTGIFLGIALEKNIDTGVLCQMSPQAALDRPQPLHVDVREDEKTVLCVGFNSFENQRNLL